jgi:hypothetical protein
MPEVKALKADFEDERAEYRELAVTAASMVATVIQPVTWSSPHWLE